MGKKLIILSMLSAFLVIPALANDTEEVTLNDIDTQSVNSKAEEAPAPIALPEVPKWSDFCEAGYENAQFSEKQNILNVINFVDAERTKSNYWAERRINFEKAIEHCNTLTDDKRAFCYDGVRRSENERNDIYQQQMKQINYKNRGIIIDKPNY